MKAPLLTPVRFAAWSLVFILAACQDSSNPTAIQAEGVGAERDEMANVLTIDHGVAHVLDFQRSGRSPRAKASANQGILGRDSVRQGPIMGLPSISDTAKPSPTALSGAPL